jgi:predicted nucleic acid-binding protein
MDESLLDTDILNEVLKQKNANVTGHAAANLAQYGQFAISSISRYEVLRGLREKGAAAQLTRFTTYCQRTLILPVVDDILDLAADLWVAGRKLGRAPNDADLIIAATALHQSRTLVTGNITHFQWINRLVVADWRNP